MNFFANNKQNIHIIFEFLAIVIVVPFLIYLLFSKNCLTSFDKFLIVLIAGTTIIVDGGLLYLNIKNNSLL